MPRCDGQRFLVVYSGALTLFVAVLFLGGAAPTGHARFDTITVQRINVIEPDGTLRMVLTNNRRMPGIMVEGREFADVTRRRGSTQAGILFYDGAATESGGLTFGGRKDEQGRISRFGHLSFDRYNQDQMFAIDAADDGTNTETVIRTIDQPNWPIQEYLALRERIQNLPPEQQAEEESRFFETHPRGVGTRLLLGTATSASSPERGINLVDLRDGTGRSRTRWIVDGAGNPTLSFFGPNGQPTYTIPPQ
jgi:hypothetical protein